MKNCVCSGKAFDRMLRPAVLTVLNDHPEMLHGYAIEKALQVFAFFQEKPPDYTGLYRLLKTMETEGLLDSIEDSSHPGPAKRLYGLTTRGKQCLARWFDSLRRYQDMLDDLLDHIRPAINK